VLWLVNKRRIYKNDRHTQFKDNNSHLTKIQNLVETIPKTLTSFVEWRFTPAPEQHSDAQSDIIPPGFT